MDGRMRTVVWLSPRSQTPQPAEGFVDREPRLPTWFEADLPLLQVGFAQKRGSRGKASGPADTSARASADP